MKNTPDPLPSVKLLPVSGPGTILGQTKSGAIFWQVISALSSTSFRARANTACSSSFIDGVPAWRTPRHYPLSRVNCILILRYSIRHCGKLNGSQSPKSGQLHSNTDPAFYDLTAEQSLNPLSRVNCILIYLPKILLNHQTGSQSPKSGQLHSNADGDSPVSFWRCNVSIP